jgi:cytoskeletal protein RodZ
MNRASAILKNAREEKSLELSDVSKKLKINKNYLEAIESESISHFPSEPYCSLIIKDYATYLGLNGEEILSLFRRDFCGPVKDQSPNTSKFSFTPQTTFRVAVTISICLFLSYLVIEYQKFNRPPQLKVNWPDISLHAADSKVEISGTTDPESTVRINNDLIITDSMGNFRKTINIASSEAKIIVEAKSQSGISTIQEKNYKASDILNN